MNLTDRAAALWQAWLAHQQADPEIQGPQLLHKVDDLIEDLLSRGELEDTVEVVMGDAEALEHHDEDLQALQQHVQHQTWTRVVHEVSRSGRNGPARGAHLVVVPMHGQTTAMKLDEPLARRLAQTVDNQAKEKHGPEGSVDLLFLPFLVVPEACSMMVVDRWRKLMDEILNGHPLAQADMLKTTSDDFQRVYEADQARLAQAGVATWGQRFALAVAVYDPKVWRGPHGLLNFLDELQDAPAWEEAFMTEQRAILPPMEMVDALVQTLATRLRLTTITAMADRQMEVIESVAFHLPTEEDLTQVMYAITPVINGMAMEEIAVPVNWLGMIGSAGIQDAMDEALSGLSEDVKALAPDTHPDNEDDDVLVPLVQPSRPRLH